MKANPKVTDATLAMNVVSDPETFAEQPDVIAWAWDALKAARGQTVNHENMGAPAHRMIANPAYDPNAARRRRIFAHTDLRGPAPLILTPRPDDAA